MLIVNMTPLKIVSGSAALGPSEGWLLGLDNFRNWLIREAA